MADNWGMREALAPLAWGSAALGEAAATPPEGWKDISCPWVESLDSPRLARMALTSCRPLM
ncbi:MAG TPA: hypothetical protein VFR41_07225, partial [Acidimicrobiia bacterium]|nr:hypothetical protein [Acidimicrobiia bacterium]